MKRSIVYTAQGKEYRIGSRVVTKREFERHDRPPPDYAAGECPRVSVPEDYSHMNGGKGQRIPGLAKSIRDQSADCHAVNYRDLERKCAAQGKFIDSDTHESADD